MYPMACVWLLIAAAVQHGRRLQAVTTISMLLCIALELSDFAHVNISFINQALHQYTGGPQSGSTVEALFDHV